VTNRQKMRTEKVSIPVADRGRTAGEICALPGHLAPQVTGVILAHGAGNDMAHPLLVSLSRGLVEAGYVTLRFNFLYRERGRRAPDSHNTLVLAWRSAFQFLKGHPEFGTDTIIAAGKSMGGRVASQMAADELLPAARLIFLGYPLHGLGRKDTLRDAHLYRIKIPMLFFVGTRDRLCELALLDGVLGKLKAPWDLETIEGGDHSFRLPKSAVTTQQDVFEHIVYKTLEWLRNET
jgi:predicted alpha/beta-hydrolase family hydrolase